MDAIEGLITQLKYQKGEEESCGNTINVLSEKLRLTIEEVESLEKQILKLSSAHTDQKSDMREIRIKISEKLNALRESFHIRSLQHIHILDDLWKLGFSGFHTRFECSIGPTEAEERMLKYGGLNSFEDWRPEYMLLSEEELEKETNFFTAELEQERVKGDAGLAYRQTLLTRTVTSLAAEKDRRLYKERRGEVKRISHKRMTREKPDHWRYTK